jgi:opacity protein-like surface antigen
MRPMSLFVLCAAAIVGASNALAGGDVPILRGSVYEGPPVQPRFIPAPVVGYRWEGFHVGGQIGFASTGVNFSRGVADLVANILRNTTVQNEFDPSQWVSLPKQAVTRPSYGGFIGYDAQYEDTVIGVEASYNRIDARMASGDTIARVVNTSDGYANDVTLSGTASIHLTDYGTVRTRFGWIYQNVVPYAFIGVAAARATVSRSANVSIIGTDADPACAVPPSVCLTPYAFAASQSDFKKGAFAYGWTLGAGIDWILFSNIFLRGEYEYIGFAKFYGVNMHIQTARTAVGLKF